MRSKSEYAMQKVLAREWAIQYIKSMQSVDFLTEENIKKYARARRRALKQFHRLRGHMRG
jgi:hypothetical protein|nr:MAG TPA: hypothetical protein [Caudoviricetes sp.]